MADMDELIADLMARRHRALQLGGPERVRRQHEAGRLTARERIERLVDPESFVELGMLDEPIQPGPGPAPADGLVAGLAAIEGRPVVVQAEDRTVFGGTGGLVGARKARRLHDWATRRGMPVVFLGDGGGLRMPEGMGSDGISERMMPVELLRHGRAVPLVTAVLGDSFGAPTWHAVSSDFACQVKGAAMAAVGPGMIEVATGERVGADELGGWRVHAETTGQVDRVAEDEAEAFGLIRRFLSYMPSHAGEEPPRRAAGDPPDRLIDAARLVPTERTRPYDMRRLVEALADRDSVFELKPRFGPALITALARLDGRVVGFVANQPAVQGGAAGPDEADKATDFICLCDSYHIPLIFLHDIPGFRVGQAAEHRRIATKIMVWNQAVAWSTVPKISVVVRKSIGAAYSNMCGPQMGADFVVAWPTAEISFTGPEVGVNVVYRKDIAEDPDPVAKRRALTERWDFDASPYRAAAKHLLDDVIDPRETRRFLCRMLDAACRGGVRSARRLANWPTGF